MRLGPLEPYNPDNPDHRDPSKYVIEYESTGRRPEKVSFDVELKDDLGRRDITINAIAIDKNGNIIDYFDGQYDIKNKIIKTVGNPHDRFTEDYLRMMRISRFSSRLGFTIDPETKKAAKELAPKVLELSAERIKDEIFKAAKQTGDKFAKYLTELDEMGILELILPEITKLKEFKHSAEFHPEGGVFDHTMEALKSNKVAEPLVNLAILLHDIGKSVTLSFKGSRPMYIDHAERGIDLVNIIADRLKMSNVERDALVYAVGNHMRFHEVLNMRPSKVVKLINDDNWDLLVQVAKADEFARGHKAMSPEDFQKVVDTAITIKKKYGNRVVNKMIKVVDGSNVVKLTGIPPGPKIGKIIKIVTDWVLDTGTDDQKEINKKIVAIAKEI